MKMIATASRTANVRSGGALVGFSFKFLPDRFDFGSGENFASFDTFGDQRLHVWIRLGHLQDSALGKVLQFRKLPDRVEYANCFICPSLGGSILIMHLSVEANRPVCFHEP
ncbi:hypothetical protein B9J07_13570 [Sinorhizobium sp. LM21]|nr:hypothetical protein B9J07_13570 [Sinorhizobium sp. LM21]